MSKATAYAKRDGRKGPRTAEQEKHWAKILEEQAQLRKRMKALQEEEKALDKKRTAAEKDQSSDEEAAAAVEDSKSAEAASGAAAPPLKKGKKDPIEGNEEQITEIISKVLQRLGGPGAAHQGTSSGGGNRSIAPPAEEVDLPTGAPQTQPEYAKPVDPLRKANQQQGEGDAESQLRTISPPASAILTTTRAARALADYAPTSTAEARERVEELLKFAQKIIATGNNAEGLKYAIQRPPSDAQKGIGSAHEKELDRNLFG